MREPKDIKVGNKTLQEILDLHKLWLNKVDGECADLCGANLSVANLSGADLRGADLCGADLSDANLSGADLSGADLLNVDLSGANLRGAKLDFTDLRFADLRGANLIGANLDFSQLNLSCKGLNFKIDERIAKQLFYHIKNLCEYSELDYDKLSKQYNESHLITKHNLPKL